MKPEIESGNLRAYLVACFAVLFLTVTTFGFILVQNFHYVDERTSQLNHAVQTLADIQELRGEIKSAEANLKDAFLRDTVEYLDVYYEAWEKYPRLIDDVEKDVVSYDLSTQPKIDELRSLINDRFMRFDEVLKTFMTDGKKGLQTFHGQKIGLNIGLKIDASLKELMVTEKARLQHREILFHEAEKLTTQFLFALISITFLFFGFSGYVIWKLISREQHQKYLLALTTELEDKVKDRTAELVESNKEMESFSYSVSHDLRAPLRAIEGYSVILIEDFAEVLGEEGMKRLKVIISNVHNMSQLIDDILSFSRLGRKDIAKVNTDLTNLAQSAITEIKKNVLFNEQTNINLNDLGFAQVDSATFRQVFVNLIGNAAKFSSKSDSPDITIGTLGTNPQTYFVRDNGVGFDMKHSNKLFNVFQRLHSANDYEGTGVGLAIVKKIINKHGGRVWAESCPNSGATFYFSLA